MQGAVGANAKEYLTRKYLLRDGAGQVVESPDEMFRRVARAVSLAELGRDSSAKRAESSFYEAMRTLRFLPTSPVLMSAGTNHGQFSSTYVVPVTNASVTSDEIRVIQASGGGVGYDLSHFGGSPSEMVRLMETFDLATRSVLQCGRRRGCNMAVMDAAHPLSREFMEARKRRPLPNTGTSLLFNDEFMEAAVESRPLAVDWDGEKKAIEPADILGTAVDSAWKGGEPGVLFVDEINRRNPAPHLGRISAVGPCAVAPLLPYESCMLGSVNLARFAHDGTVDIDGLRGTVRTAARFLDDAVTVNRYPSAATREAALLTRKIGVGVMGLADMLASSRIPYGSKRACDVTERVMAAVQDEAHEVSVELAAERGAFPAQACGSGADPEPTRNATSTAVAPTGSISVIAGCWGGIEPYYGVPVVQRVLDDLTLTEENGLYRAMNGGAQGPAGGEARLASEVFRPAKDIPPEDQVQMLAAVQRHVDNSVSKTVTLAEDSTPEDVRKTIVLAWRLGCKGVAVFRIGSVDGWVLRSP